MRKELIFFETQNDISKLYLRAVALTSKEMSEVKRRIKGIPGARFEKIEADAIYAVVEGDYEHVDRVRETLEAEGWEW